MARRLFVVAALVLLGVPRVLVADASVHDSPRVRAGAPRFELLPLGVSAYRTPDAAQDVVPLLAAESSRGSLAALAPAGNPSGFLSSANESSSKKKYLPVAMSLLVPGTGEMYMGYYFRGAVLLAAEITAWTGYFYYHDKGLDSRAEYERFADEHWDYDKWIYDHPATQDLPPEDRTFATLDSIGRNEWGSQWPGYHSWYSKEDEKQNYYENIGKYDWYISGWEDWDVATQPHDTDLRTTYRSMRTQSNDELDNANKFIYLSITARVFSLVETVLLTRRGDSGSSKASATPGFSIDARATGPASGEVALVYRFQ